MSQSNYIAAALAIAFLIYITMRGSLTKYITLLTGGAGFGQDTASAGNEPQKTANVDGTPAPSSAGGVVQAAGAAVNAATSGDATAAPLTILQSVIKAGGPADAVLDGVQMFGSAAGFLGI